MLEASSIGVCGGVSIGEILDDRSVLMCRFNPDVKSRKLNRRKTSLVNCVDVVVFLLLLFCCMVRFLRKNQHACYICMGRCTWLEDEKNGGVRERDHPRKQTIISARMQISRGDNKTIAQIEHKARNQIYIHTHCVCINSFDE